MERCGGVKAQGAGAKPHLRYSDIFKPLDLSALEYEKSVLLLDGERVVYSGHHHDRIIWLKRKGKVEFHRQAEVMPRLRLP